MKIGRNDPCPCGSGKKYKRCCISKNNSNPIITEVETTPELESLRQSIIEENENRRELFLEPLGIFIDFVKPIIFKTKKFWVLGNRVYYNRPENETFHEFIISVLLNTLGEEWYKNQSLLQLEDQHFIYCCYKKYLEWRKKNISNHSDTKISCASPDGWTKSILSLAFDICSLVHKEHLPEGLLNRLKNKDQYQGVRYEIAISAIIARLNYKINFLDEQNLKTIHPEFIAENRDTREKVAVEGKSKVREGILHKTGKPISEDSLLWGDIQRLYRHALKQNPGNLPFIVFIDLNSPITPNIKIENKPWFKDIKKMLQKAPLFDSSNPDPCTALVFTNYSYHYQTEKEALPGEHLLIWPEYPKYHINNPSFLSHFEKALTHYGIIPNLDIEVNL